MKKFWRVAGWLGLIGLVVFGYCAYRTVWGTPFTLNMLANRQTIEFLIRNPETFSQVGIIDGTIFDHHSDKLAAVGVEKRDKDYAQLQRFRDELNQFDRSKLDRQDRITYDLLADQYQSALAFKRFDWMSSEGLYPIAPMWGVQVNLPNFLLSGHVIKNEKTARNYVRRLEAASDKLDSATAEMARQSKLGVVEPISLLERALSGIADTVKPAPEDNPLVTTFIERMDEAPGLDGGLKADLKHQAVTANINELLAAR